MKFSGANPKILARHLSLLAVIYIRQSTLRQVRKHKGSALYQRSFRELAQHYGWPDDLIVVNDQDLGVSGRVVAGREGYKSLRQLIFEGRVGAVFCAEESRLDRNFSAFTQLINLCAACNTLIIDENGVYDPNNDNDWTFLGHAGVSNEGERRRLIQRSIATTRALAEARELRLVPPTGYVYADDGKMIIDPDEEEGVSAALRLFFDAFDLYGSAMQTVKQLNRRGIKFPTRKRGFGKDRPVTWGELTISRAMDILRNPAYAGAYVYGQTKAVWELLGAETAEEKRRRISVDFQADEVILIRDAHEGYITWEKFEENQQRLKDNKYSFITGSRGAVKNGPALLQGVLRCKQCDRAMSPLYYGKKSKIQSGYRCFGNINTRGINGCIHTSVPRLDKAVTEALFEALNPARLRMTLQALEQADDKVKADARKLAETIRQARAEVDKARRKLDSIDAEYDLVAKEYQKTLQEKLAVAERLESQRAKALKSSSRQLPEKVRQSILDLSKDVKNVWERAEVTNVERKMLLRLLINKVTITKREKTNYLDVEIHWAAGAVTQLVHTDGRYLHPEAVELIRKLAPDHTVSQIAEILNQADYKSIQGRPFTGIIIQSAARRYRIQLGCSELPKKDNKPRGDGRYSSRSAARMLNVSLVTVARWCNIGILDGVRRTPTSPFWIKLTSDQISQLKKKPRATPR